MRLFKYVGLAIACLTPSLASAADGVIKGYWYFYQNQGNYCDESIGMDCTAANYLASEFNTNQPVKNTKLYIKDQNGTVIGSGTTSTAGYFNIGWYSASTPSSVRVYWQLENKDNRFRVRGSEGGTYAYWTPALPVKLDQTYDSGSWLIGSFDAPSGIANIYDGADRMWYDALNYSGRMQASFTDLEIRAYPTDCPTACANGSSNRVHMPSGSEYMPQARILHEMGHIASYKSKPRRTTTPTTDGGYCYPSTTGKCGWSFTSEEWRGSALEEGRATFFGDVALYWHWATDARSCIGDGTCGTGGRLEPSFAYGECAATVGRTALQNDRYMWDIYDSVSDEGETNAAPYYAFFDTIASMPTGYDWGETESPYQDSSSTVDSWDSFHSYEWWHVMKNNYSGAIDTLTPYYRNCMGYF